MTRPDEQAKDAAMARNNWGRVAVETRQQHADVTLNRPASTVSARYPGKCSRCGGDYSTGTKLIRHDSRWVHVDC